MSELSEAAKKNLGVTDTDAKGGQVKQITLKPLDIQAIQRELDAYVKKDLELSSDLGQLFLQTADCYVRTGLRIESALATTFATAKVIIENLPNLPIWRYDQATVLRILENENKKLAEYIRLFKQGRPEDGVA